MKDWDQMTFRQQLRHNLGALFSLHGETVSPHWASTRSLATRIALERLETYQVERETRVHSYGRPHRVLGFADRRFTRAIGR